MALSPELKDSIQKVIDTHEVVLFMKGTRSMPQCGFSSAVVQVLQRMGVDFHDVDVLADIELREGIKEFSSWPTIPQLYIKGKFVGGCDIVREMHKKGELEPLFKAS